MTHAAVPPLPAPARARRLLAVAVSVRAATAAGAQTPPDDEAITITFLANAVVLLSSGGHAVIIDGLFRRYERGYADIGDAELSDETFAPFRLDTSGVDMALVPSWAVTSTEGRRLIERWIRPRRVVDFHVAEGEGDRIAREVRAAMPSAITFSRSLESLRW